MNDFFVRWVKNLFFVGTAGFSTVGYLVVMKAYSSVSKVACFNINYYGEAKFEAILVLCYLIVLILRTYIYFKETEVKK